MIHEREVRSKIARVVQDEVSVEDFSRWIMANSWNMRNDSSPDAVELVSSVHLLLAERDEDLSYSHGAFRRELAALLNNVNDQVVLDIAGPSMPYINRRSLSRSYWLQPDPVLLQFA